MITYDEIGNPLTYRDGMRMTWQNGRQLASLQKGEDVISYQYEANGLRVGKTVNGVQTKYHYDDAGRVVMADKAGDQMWFFYNPDGTAMSMKYRGLRYYYVKNQQGDVTGITDQNGNVIVNYEYDAWGKLLGITGSDGTALTEGSLADTISKLNPFRYRSYVYDDETGLYYLKSRFYDPVTGRFVNADGYVSTGDGLLGHNMFTYCSNNPVNFGDPSGNKKIGLKQMLAAAAAATRLAAKGVPKAQTITGKFSKGSAGNSGGGLIGAGITTVDNRKVGEKIVSPGWSPIKVTTGSRLTTTISKTGDSSKPVSFYAIERTNNHWLSSAGLKLNISNATFNASLGMDNIGGIFSYKNGNSVTNISTRTDLSTFSTGYEISTSTI